MSDLNYAPNSRPVGRLRPVPAWLAAAVGLAGLAVAIGVSTDRSTDSVDVFASPASQAVHLDWRGNSAGVERR